MLIPGDETHRGPWRERDVDESLGRPALSAVSDRLAAEVVAGFELARVRLVGNDADGTRLRTRAIQRALRAFEHLDPLNVVHMHVNGAVDGRHRLLVEVGADGGLRAGMVAVLAAVDSAHVD